MTIMPSTRRALSAVLAPDGRVTQHPGGGAFNTARTLGRLGQAVAFVGRLSQDQSGRSLRAALWAAGVSLDGAVATEDPTTIALVDLGDGETVRYRFYANGTSVSGLWSKRARRGHA